jgi:hypothetical protein
VIARIELSSDSLNLGMDVDDSGRIAIATIPGGGTSPRARHHVPARSCNPWKAAHPTPVLRLAGSTGPARLRYGEHRPASMAKPTGWR